MHFFFFFQAEDGIRDLVRSRGLGDVYKRQPIASSKFSHIPFGVTIESRSLMLSFARAYSMSWPYAAKAIKMKKINIIFFIIMNYEIRVSTSGKMNDKEFYCIECTLNV
mgnify:CR=1 FL=1